MQCSMRQGPPRRAGTDKAEPSVSTKALAFEQAFAALTLASEELDREVELRMAECRSADDLMALAESLPKGYHNVRRVYERAGRVAKGLTT